MAWTNPTCPNVTDYATFLYGSVGISNLVLPSDSEWIPLSLSIADATVNRALEGAQAQANSATGIVTLSLYVIAVYNLATDRLFNYASDIPGQSFFKDERSKMGLMTPAVGVATAASDQGTAGTLKNPDQLAMLTLDDLQTLKTPWGRRYLGFAQAQGTLWGLS